MGIESLSALLSDGLVAAGVNEMLRSLLVDGIVAGVGGILTFLPNIFILAVDDAGMHQLVCQY